MDFDCRDNGCLVVMVYTCYLMRRVRKSRKSVIRVFGTDRGRETLARDLGDERDDRERVGGLLTPYGPTIGGSPLNAS